MSAVSEISDFQTMQFEEVPLQNLFDKQRAYFATDVTKTYEWRIDQLDRLIRMLKDNYERFSDASRRDFETAAQENVTYADLGTLLAKIKSLPKPLAGYVFSRNQRAIDRVLQSLSFGRGAVNQTNVFLFIESMPYGGVGTSGIGNYYGKYGYDSLTHAKSILISPPDVAIDHLFPPYTREKVQSLNQWFEY